MPNFYALADVVVVPSRFPEGFGRVIAEACAFEKCVVVSRHGAAPEIVLEGETGFLAEPHNVVDLAKVLDKVLSLSEEEARRFQKNARNHVARLFSQQQFQEKTLDVYREIFMPLA
jgi:glycosyltransferase involved in cell wall biosynthesis